MHSLPPTFLGLILISSILCTSILSKDSNSKDDKVLLTQVKVLTVFHNKFTTGRRSPSLPQLMCVGGDACDHFQPESMQCKNMGNDGYTVQWKCDAEMEDYFRLGQVTVNCEGYKNREDKYILRGSCAVEYSLHLTEKGKRWKSQTKSKDPFQRQHNYKHQHKPYINFTDYVVPHWSYVFILVPALWYFYTRFFRSNLRPNRGSGPYHPHSSFDGGDHDSRPPPPPYYHSNKPQNYPQSAPPPSTSSSSNGFWTGAGLGAAAGYAAARVASASSSTSQTNAPGNNENPWFSFLRPSNGGGINRRDRSSSSSFDSFDRDESPSPPRSYRSSNFGSSSNR